MSDLKKILWLDHLRELKVRLLYCLIFFLVTFLIVYLNIEDILLFLAKPLLNLSGGGLISTSITETFFSYLRLAFVLSFGFSCPFFLLQIYYFIAPALIKQEKHFSIFLFMGFVLLFIVGVSVLYFFVLPNAFSFLMKYQKSDVISVVLQSKISEYIDFVVSMLIGFGVSFQLPLLLILFCKIGLFSYQQLVRFRKVAIVIIFVVAAIVTPPDIPSQLILASLLILLYEISLFFIRFFILKKEESDIIVEEI